MCMKMNEKRATTMSRIFGFDAGVVFIMFALHLGINSWTRTNVSHSIYALCWPYIVQ
jgi:hypothetical protein